MATLTDNLRAKQARPIFFELPDGTTVEIAAPSLAQVKACLQVEVALGAPKTAAEEMVRFERTSKILLGPAHAHLLDDLNALQVQEIVGALYVAFSGLNPEAYVRWQRTQRDAGIKADAIEVLTHIEGAITDLAARLKIPPEDAAEMPMADAIALRERMDALERSKLDVLALVMGRELEWR